MSAKTIAIDHAFYRLCGECGQHAALFRYRGVVKRDGQHDLCFRCFRSLANQVNAAALQLETCPSELGDRPLT